MGNSNSTWGQVAAENPARAQRWDEAYPLTHDAPKWVHALARDRGLSFLDLARTGARLTDYEGSPALVWLFPDGLKYRLIDGERRTEKGARFDRFHIVPCREGRAKGVIVAEGETDAAQLSKLTPFYDIAITPAGARFISDTMVDELARYGQVMVALDNDEAGNAGADLIMGRIPGAVRILPPDGATDWCEAAVKELIPPRWSPEEAIASSHVASPVFTFGQVLDADLGTRAENNWFADGILPVRGLAIVHGRKKSGKSWCLLEIVRAITTGTPLFSGGYAFTRPAGPAKALLIQLEVLPYAFQERVLSVVAQMPDEQKQMFQDNAQVLNMGDGQVPRLKVGDPDFEGRISRAIEQSGAEVVLFDPVQRFSGARDINNAHEAEALLDYFARLQQAGLTVIAAHHNNKASGKGERDPDAMTGSQRFSGDADSLMSVWFDEKNMPADDNPERIKQRGISFTLRNGAAAGRLMTIRPNPTNPDLASVVWEPLPAFAQGKSATPAGDQPDIF